MSTNLQKIDHIVVLMLENRSFDNVLGRLYASDNSEPFRIPPRGQSFDGVAGKNLSNPLPGGEGVVSVGISRDLSDPSPDPGEEFEHVSRQVGDGRMDGFVADYIQHFEQSEGRPPTPQELSVIMNSFTPTELPVLCGLARNFAVCDRWFASVPSQTLCNRVFSQSATSRGFVNNAPLPKWLLTRSKTVFELLSEAGLDWSVFYDELDLMPLTRLVQPTLWRGYDKHFKSMASFHQQAASGTLPPYSFLEPRFFLDHNDAHPPLTKQFLVTSSVAAAELLVNSVYEALRNGPGWEKTLLVVTFDEHGGCYDHVPPPAATPPLPDGAAGEAGFCFDRLGVRVPAILVSPWVEAGSVISTEFDHSSLIKTVGARWGLEPLTERDRAANDLGEALSLPLARTDQVELTPHPYTPHSEHAAAPLNPLQRYILEAVAAYEAVQQMSHEGCVEEKLKTAWQLLQKETKIAGLKTVGEATDYLASRLDPETGWLGGTYVQ